MKGKVNINLTFNADEFITLTNGILAAIKCLLFEIDEMEDEHYSYDEIYIRVSELKDRYDLYNSLLKVAYYDDLITIEEETKEEIRIIFEKYTIK